MCAVDGQSAALLPLLRPCNSCAITHLKNKLKDTACPVFPFLFLMAHLLKCPSALLLLALLFAAAPYIHASTEEEFDPFHEGQDL